MSARLNALAAKYLVPRISERVTAAELYDGCDRCCSCDGPLLGARDRSGLAHRQCSEDAMREADSQEAEFAFDDDADWQEYAAVMSQFDAASVYDGPRVEF